MAAMEEDQQCWICLCGPDVPDTGEDDQCVRVCACPRVCHKRCLGRWQLQNAGKKEEKYCRFCQQRYPDWRNSLTPGEITPSTPVMAVSVRGKVYKLRVRSGPEGKEDFKRQIRQLLGFTQDMDFDVIFECKTPHNGAEKVQLHGFEAFEAASWCAAVSAAKRKKAKQEAAARAAAAAAALAAANGGGLTPMASCPAALSMPESRPSSSDGSSAAAASSSDGSSSDVTVAPDALHSTAQHDAGASVAPSAFATATASAAAAMTGCPASASSLLTSAVSEPYPGPSTLGTTPSSSGAAVGMFGLQAAGSSVPHALIEEHAAASTRHVSSSSTRTSHDTHGSRRRSSCPGERLEEGSAGGHSIRPRPASASGLQQARSMPLGSSAGSSRGSSNGPGSSSGGEREEGGEGDGRGKVGRWLRRVLHLEGPWKAAVPIAGVFMGVV